MPFTVSVPVVGPSVPAIVLTGPFTVPVPLSVAPLLIDMPLVAIEHAPLIASVPPLTFTGPAQANVPPIVCVPLPILLNVVLALVPVTVPVKVCPPPVTLVSTVSEAYVLLRKFANAYVPLPFRARTVSAYVPAYGRFARNVPPLRYSVTALVKSLPEAGTRWPGERCY